MSSTPDDELARLQRIAEDGPAHPRELRELLEAESSVDSESDRV